MTFVSELFARDILESPAGPFLHLQDSPSSFSALLAALVWFGSWLFLPFSKNQTCLEYFGTSCVTTKHFWFRSLLGMRRLTFVVIIAQLFLAMVGTLGALLRPGGDLFLSTLNRTPKAFAVAIVGAEYLARLLPRGTHEDAKFIRPSEIAAAARHHGLECLEIAGLNYNPITGFCTLTRDPSVNYLVHLRRAGPVSG